jgi:hypothetical protein
MKTYIHGSQILDKTIAKAYIDTITPGSALITKVLPGVGGVTLESSGIDEGTGDVTISISGYVHNQMSPSITWNIFHNLGKFPSVSVVDSAGTIVYGDITYIDINNISLSFSAPFAGKAYLN